MRRRGYLLALLVCIGLRLFTLEYPDLIDPTESRYAFVAQEMVLSGDWVVPKLPADGEIGPYLGKPPLHFWLTAAGFTAFGMEEWVARLPSFLGLVLICGALLYLGRFVAIEGVGELASLVVVSSGLMFYMSGGSVVDVTLAAWTSVAFVAAFSLAQGTGRPLWPSVFLAVGLALGFLTKGPIAIVLVGVPAAIWLAVTRQFGVLQRTRWVVVTVVFATIAVPWFVLAQSRNPDFLRYFFVNENFGRYFLADYGDRYGTGHRYPFGTVWLMYAASFLPWTIPLAVEAWCRRHDIQTRQFWADRAGLAFFALWAASPAVVFTFARQLHPAYVLPGVPGLALVTAVLIHEAPERRRRAYLSAIAWVLVVLAAVFAGVGLSLGTTGWYLLLSAAPLAFLLVDAVRVARRKVCGPTVARMATATFALSILALADHVSDRRSAEPILRCVAWFSPATEPAVGIVDAGSYSLHFYSRAWREELTKPVALRFIASSSLPPDLPTDLIVRTRDYEKSLRSRLPTWFYPVASTERWTWLREASQKLAVTECPDETL